MALADAYALAEAERLLEPRDGRAHVVVEKHGSDSDRRRGAIRRHARRLVARQGTSTRESLAERHRLRRARRVIDLQRRVAEAELLPEEALQVVPQRVAVA